MSYRQPPLHMAKLNAIAKKLLSQQGREFGSDPESLAFRDSLKTRYDIQAQYLLQTGAITADQTVQFFADKSFRTLSATITPTQRSTELRYERARPELVAEYLARQSETGAIPANLPLAAGAGAPVVQAEVRESDGGAIAPAPVISRAVSSTEKFDTRFDKSFGDPYIIYKVLPSESELAKDEMDDYLESGATNTGQDLIVTRKSGDIYEAYDKTSRRFVGFFQFYTRTIYPYDYEALKLDFEGDRKHERVVYDWGRGQKEIRRKEMAEEERRLFFEAQEKQAKQEYDDFVSQQRAKGILTDYTVPENPDVTIVERKKSKMGDRWIDSKGIQYYKAGASYFTKSDELRPESEIGSKFLDIGNHYSLEGKFLGQRVPSINKSTVNTTISGRPGETVLRKVSFR